MNNLTEHNQVFLSKTNMTRKGTSYSLRGHEKNPLGFGLENDTSLSAYTNSFLASVYVAKWEALKNRKSKSQQKF